MTKAELIELMFEYSDDTMVVIPGYQGGLSDVSWVEEVKLKLNVNSAWYYGPHEAEDDGDTVAIYLH
jgi:hypothetical protein